MGQGVLALSHARVARSQGREEEDGTTIYFRGKRENLSGENNMENIGFRSSLLRSLQLTHKVYSTDGGAGLVRIRAIEKSMAAPLTMHEAARAGDVPALMQLLALGAGAATGLDSRDAHNRTPLMLAAWAGHIGAVRVLIGAKAKVSVGAGDDMNALHFAALKGHAECLRALLAAGVSVNSRTRRGATALHFASQGGERVGRGCKPRGGGASTALAPRVMTHRRLASARSLPDMLYLWTGGHFPPRPSPPTPQATLHASTCC